MALIVAVIVADAGTVDPDTIWLHFGLVLLQPVALNGSGDILHIPLVYGFVNEPSLFLLMCCGIDDFCEWPVLLIKPLIVLCCWRVGASC